MEMGGRTKKEKNRVCSPVTAIICVNSIAEPIVDICVNSVCPQPVAATICVNSMRAENASYFNSV